jgi:hypothetical protein
MFHDMSSQDYLEFLGLPIRERIEKCLEEIQYLESILVDEMYVREKYPELFERKSEYITDEFEPKTYKIKELIRFLTAFDANFDYSIEGDTLFISSGIPSLEPSDIYNKRVSKGVSYFIKKHNKIRKNAIKELRTYIKHIDGE